MAAQELWDMIRLPIPCEILLLLRQSWEWMWSRLLKTGYPFRQSEGGYITLLASLKPFSSFASFTYMIENDKAIYVTGYAKTALSMPSLGVKAHPFPKIQKLWPL